MGKYYFSMKTNDILSRFHVEKKQGVRPPPLNGFASRVIGKSLEITKKKIKGWGVSGKLSLRVQWTDGQTDRQTSFYFVS